MWLIKKKLPVLIKKVLKILFGRKFEIFSPSEKKQFGKTSQQKIFRLQEKKKLLCCRPSISILAEQPLNIWRLLRTTRAAKRTFNSWHAPVRSSATFLPQPTRTAMKDNSVAQQRPCKTSAFLQQSFVVHSTPRSYPVLLGNSRREKRSSFHSLSRHFWAGEKRVLWARAVHDAEGST